MSKNKRVISAENAEEFAVWSLPKVSPGLGNSSPDSRSGQDIYEIPTLPTAAELETIRAEAQKEGYLEGLEKGREEARLQSEQEYKALLKEKIQQWDQVLASMTRPLDEIDSEVLDELLQLVSKLTRHIVHREIATHPDEIVAIMRESLTALPSSARHIQVHLHPEDKLLVEEALLGNMNNKETTLIADPALSRGDCILETKTSRVDSRLDKRLDDIIAQFLGQSRDYIEPEDSVEE